MSTLANYNPLLKEVHLAGGKQVAPKKSAIGRRLKKRNKHLKIGEFEARTDLKEEKLHGMPVGRKKKVAKKTRGKGLRMNEQSKR